MARQPCLGLFLLRHKTLLTVTGPLDGFLFWLLALDHNLLTLNHGFKSKTALLNLKREINGTAEAKVKKKKKERKRREIRHRKESGSTKIKTIGIVLKKNHTDCVSFYPL